MEIGLYTPILDAIDSQFEYELCTLDLHVQLEVQVIELDPFGRRQTCEQSLRHGIQVGRERAHIDQVFVQSIRSFVAIATDQVVFDYKGLAGSEVAGVVKGDGCVGGDWGALEQVVSVVAGFSIAEKTIPSPHAIASDR